MMGFERYFPSKQWLDYRLPLPTGRYIEVTCYWTRASYPYTITYDSYHQFINCTTADEVLREVLNLLDKVK